MNHQSPSQQGSVPPLSTPEDAIRHALQAYFQATLDRISSYFGQAHRSKYYSQLSNQEIFRRGFFLTHLYDALIALHSISLHWKNPQSQPFRVFLNSLILTTDDFTKITRINNECILQNQTKINQRILALLYQTEFYIYQILLRVVLLKLAFQEQEKALAQIEAISKNCMFPEYFPVDRKMFATKRERSRLKQIISDVASMLNCYHLELSINRSECLSRPEANCLVHLLRKKLSKPLFQFIQEHIKFRCDGIIPPQIKFEEKMPIKKPLAITAQSIANLPKAIQPATVPKEAKEIPKEVLPNINYQKEMQQQAIPIEDPQSNHPHPPQQAMHFEVQPSPILRPLSNIFAPAPPVALDKEKMQEEKPVPNDTSLIKQYPPEMLQTPKKKKSFRRPSNLLEQHRKDSDQASKKSEDIIQPNLPQFRYERHLHPRTPSEKPKKNSKQNSLKEQLKAPTRFAHTQCNLKYVTKFKKNSRRDKDKLMNGQLRFNTNPLPPNNYYVRPPKKQEESDESYLAEETPVYRSRAGITSEQTH